MGVICHQRHMAKRCHYRILLHLSEIIMKKQLDSYRSRTKQAGGMHTRYVLLRIPDQQSN